MFEDLYTKIDDPTALEQLTPEAVTDLKTRYPQLSPEYFTFLAEIGHGNLGNIIVYDSPMHAVDVYTEAKADALAGIVLFGDDTQGFCYGFDLHAGGRVVEVDPRGRIDRTIESSFVAFLRAFLEA